jgi:hypothetical protein
MTANRNKIKFTLSVSPALSRDSFSVITAEPTINRLKKLKNSIYDINFTFHMEPFMRDAHGVYSNRAENQIHLRHMLDVQEKTGITVTPVFNNIYVPNTKENLELFINNFWSYYEMGLRSISVPHVIWMKWVDLHKVFPGITIKDTVLRRVKTGQDFWNHADAGYDYINLDQTLVRDIKSLKSIKKAQDKFRKMTGRNVVTSLIHGEGCLGYCSLWDEHYQHTLTHPNLDDNIYSSIEYFRVPQYLSCYPNGDSDAQSLRCIGLPVFTEDLDEICGYFDIIKLAGRKAFQTLGDCLNFIETFHRKDTEILETASNYIINLFNRGDTQQKLLQRWRKTTKYCRFQCWDCDVCSEVISFSIANKIDYS